MPGRQTLERRGHAPAADVVGSLGDVGGKETEMLVQRDEDVVANELLDPHFLLGVERNELFGNAVDFGGQLEPAEVAVVEVGEGAVAGAALVEAHRSLRSMSWAG